MSFVRVFPRSWEAPAALPLPSGVRPPFDWTPVTLGPAVLGGGSPLLLKFSDDARRYTGWRARLRFTTAAPAPGEHVIGAFFTRGRGNVPAAYPFATADVSDSGPLQVLDISLDAESVVGILQGGLLLRQIRGLAPLPVFTETAPDAPTLRPHLLFEDPRARKTNSRLNSLFGRMLSPMDMAQPFGLSAGCVLDGLFDLIGLLGEGRVRRALECYLSAYFDRVRLVVREAPDGSPGDGRLYGLEDTLPFAALVRTDTTHPALRLALAFWEARTSEGDDGLILEGHAVTAAGSYTVAYPMAVAASLLPHLDLERAAIRQFLLRRNRLQSVDTFFGQTDASGMRDMASQGAAGALGFYLLGMARALPFLRDRPATDEIGATLRVGCTYALRYQRSTDGLWCTRVDSASSGPDVVGSLGIATALARADALGWAPPGAGAAARHTFQTIVRLLTPDGLLPGVPTCALGLLVQLAAAIPNPELPALPMREV